MTKIDIDKFVVSLRRRFGENKGIATRLDDCLRDQCCKYIDTPGGGKLSFFSPGHRKSYQIPESEDERMRNAAINACKYMVDNFENSTKQYEDAITWLEKQGEQKPADKIAKFREGDSIQFKGFGHNKYTIKEVCGLSHYINTMGNRMDMSYTDANFEVIKDSDNVEPKFKIGDWIVYRENIWKVGNIALENYYELLKTNNEVATRSIKEVDENAHIWTIQDAKDGDVLTCYSDIKGQPIEQTGIIKQYVGRHGGCSNSFKAHFGVDWDNNVVIEGYMGSSNIYPSTKEQRDLLFQKMKEAGYEWDAEKKELKKIEQKLAEWSEEDEKCFNILISLINNPSAEGIFDYHQINKSAFNNWVKSLKERVQPQPKQEWSEEDEQAIEDAETWLDTLYDYLKDSSSECIPTVKEVISKLKSLRPQNRWKPSEEQIHHLSYVVDCFDVKHTKVTHDVLLKLLEQLKAL